MRTAIGGRCTRACTRAMDHGDTIEEKDNISEDTGTIFIGGDFQEVVEEIVKLLAVREARHHIVGELDAGILVDVASIQNMASAKMSNVEILEAIEGKLILMTNMCNEDVRVGECRTRVNETFGGDDFTDKTVHHSDM